MLKAVRFDPESHKYLIEYIENYTDKRGKPNHSEAIRMLMEKGFEAMNLKPVIQEVIVEEKKPDIDINKLKEEIMKEIWGTIGKTALVQTPAQVILPQQNSSPIEQPKQEIPQAPKPKIQKTPVNTGGLMGNLLGNANRG